MDWAGLPPLSALRAFAAFAEYGSVTKAGEALNVSHAAISQQLRGLESHLGVKLLDRSGRALHLTAEGHRLAKSVGDGFSGIALAVAELTGADEDRPLHVSCTPGFAASWLMPRLSDFRYKNPGIDVMLNPTPDLVSYEPGGIDVGIRHGKGKWPGLEAELLMPARLVVVAAAELVDDLTVKTPEDLLSLPWVQELGTTEVTDWLYRNGVTTKRTKGAMQVPGNLLLDGVRSGHGVAVTIADWVQPDIDAGRLRLLFSEPEDTGYYIVSRSGVTRKPARAFVKWLRRQV